jgi:secondary thiamine-phosphate synthase enzyme
MRQKDGIHCLKRYNVRMTVTTLSISLSTQGNAEMRDITDQIAKNILQSGLKNGIVTVFCPSSTSALTTIEYESGALNDLRRLFEEIIPTNREYAHNERWHDGNGHSHVRAALLGSSLTIPFVDGQLTLGTWQQVIYVDFDNRPRQRKLIVQLIGE